MWKNGRKRSKTENLNFRQSVNFRVLSDFSALRFSFHFGAPEQQTSLIFCCFQECFCSEASYRRFWKFLKNNLFDKPAIENMKIKFANHFSGLKVAEENNKRMGRECFPSLPSFPPSSPRNSPIVFRRGILNVQKLTKKMLQTPINSAKILFCDSSGLEKRFCCRWPQLTYAEK